MKVVINTQIGGFHLSLAAGRRLRDLGHEVALSTRERFGSGDGYAELSWSFPRHHPDLVAVVEELGSAANPERMCTLTVVEVPDDVVWRVVQHDDGTESVVEQHRSWGPDGEHQARWATPAELLEAYEHTRSDNAAG